MRIHGGAGALGLKDVSRVLIVVERAEASARLKTRPSTLACVGTGVRALRARDGAGKPVAHHEQLPSPFGASVVASSAGRSAAVDEDVVVLLAQPGETIVEHRSRTDLRGDQGTSTGDEREIGQRVFLNNSIEGARLRSKSAVRVGASVPSTRASTPAQSHPKANTGTRQGEGSGQGSAGDRGFAFVGQRRRDEGVPWAFVIVATRSRAERRLRYASHRPQGGIIGCNRARTIGCGPGTSGICPIMESPISRLLRGTK